MIALDRPLALIDLETTGMDSARDSIVQLCVLKMYPDGTEKLWSTLFNPRCSIPEHVTKLHGIDNEKVANSPVFGMMASTLFKGLNSVDVMGFNVKFDVGMLQAEFMRHGFDYLPGRILDVFHIYTRYFPRNLTSAVKEYLGREHTGAHEAEADVLATREVFEAQLERHAELPRNFDALVSMLTITDPTWLDVEGKFRWEGTEAICNFGKKYRGILLRKIPADFLQWMLESNFAPDTKAIVREALRGNFPIKEKT